MIKNTHTDAQTKYDVKEKHISFGAIVHIVARAVGAPTWTERVGTQQWHLHPTVFISAHNGAGLHLHGPERLQFSALGEKRGVIKKALSKALTAPDARVASTSRQTDTGNTIFVFYSRRGEKK